MLWLSLNLTALRVRQRGVFLFCLSVFGYSNSTINMSELSPNWTGKHYEQYDSGHISFESDWDRVKTDGGGGYTSAAPIYLGLMAIGGSILLSSYNIEPNIKD